nr:MULTISPECIES: RluA family pseudouridine synthase [unclassified Gemella]
MKFDIYKEALLRDFLVENNISRKTLTRIKFDADGSIKVNGKEENVRYKLSLGDVVEVALPSENFSDNVRFINSKINIIFEDDYFLIVDKPKNLPTIPSRNSSYESLLERVNYYFQAHNYNTIPHIVTRLDKDTTGLVLIAKHRHIHALFSKDNIYKYYLAVVNGEVKENQIIESNIARESDSIIKRKVSSEGLYSKTKLSVIEYYKKIDATLIKLKLYTGRTHQIRVHCSHIGHSLLGDKLYGGEDIFIDRQALHCYNLSFCHPITKERLNFISDLPEDINNILD